MEDKGSEAMPNGIDRLIDELAENAKPVECLHCVAHYVLRLGTVLVLFALAVGIWLGLRDDLMLQWLRPAYAVEILLLGALALATLIAMVQLAWPDANSQTAMLKMPYILTGLLITLMLLQILLPVSDPIAAGMVIPSDAEDHHFFCTLWIAALTAIPSFLLFAMLRRGATTQPGKAGAYAMLAAAAVGCIIVRLSEPHDGITHLLLFHYLPTLFFAGLGVLVGRAALRW